MSAVRWTGLQQPAKPWQVLYALHIGYWMTPVPRTFFPLPAALAILLCLLAGAAGAQKDVPRVRVVDVAASAEPGQITLTGNVTAERDAQLSPRLDGLVAEVLVDAGDRVSAGDVLLRQDDTLAGFALQRAEAARAEARTQLEEAERLRDEQEVLARDGRIPASSFKSQQAEARLAEAALQRLDVEVAEARERLRRHALVAPFDGVVSRRRVDPGEWLGTGAAALDLIAIDRVRIDVQVPQRYIATLEVGSPAEVRLDAMPEQTLEGRVQALVPVSDPDARTFLVRVLADQPSASILPGLSAQVTLRTAAAREQLRIPRDAIMRFPDDTAVAWVVTPSDDGEPIARRRPLTLGATLGDEVVVREGLRAGEQVVVRGNERLRDGQRVEVVDDTD